MNTSEQKFKRMPTKKEAKSVNRVLDQIVFKGERPEDLSRAERRRRGWRGPVRPAEGGSFLPAVVETNQEPEMENT